MGFTRVHYKSWGHGKRMELHVGAKHGHSKDSKGLQRPTTEFARTHMGGCQNYDPFWGTLNIRCRIIIWIQKGTLILTATHMSFQPLLPLESELESELEPELEVEFSPAFRLALRSFCLRLCLCHCAGLSP